MKSLLLKSTIILVILTGCKKNNQTIIVEGTVMQVNGTNAFVKIHNAGVSRYSFLCSDFPATMDTSAMSVTCANAVFILNLPETLAVEGKQIRFTRFKDKGPNPIWSMSFAAHDILVYDAREF